MKKHYGNQPDFFNKISSQRYLIEKHLVDYKEGNPENQKSIFCTPKKSGASHPILTHASISPYNLFGKHSGFPFTSQ